LMMSARAFDDGTHVLADPAQSSCPNARTTVDNLAVRSYCAITHPSEAVVLVLSTSRRECLWISHSLNPTAP